MRLDELTPDERLALGGLLRLMVRSDGDFSEAEEATINALGERLAGDPARMWSAISQSAQDCPTDDAIRTAVAAVARPEARALLRDAAREVAAGDEVVASEHALLVWLDGAWA